MDDSTSQIQHLAPELYPKRNDPKRNDPKSNYPTSNYPKRNFAKRNYASESERVFVDGGSVV